MKRQAIVIIFCIILSSQFASANSTEIKFQLCDDSITHLNEATLVSTFIGGECHDEVVSITTDSDGNYILVGSTCSNDFPIVNAINETNPGETDVFVMKVNKTGTEIIYSTYIGGNGTDVPLSCALDSDGNLYVTGVTSSTNFPTINALNSSINGGYDAFVFKLNSNGSALEYSTYIGGSQDDYGVSIAVDASGNAFVGGQTRSSTFPVRNGIDETFNGNADYFLTMLNATGNGIVFSTFIGGKSTERVECAIEINDEFVYMAGSTHSSDFPITSDCFQSSNSGESDGFILRIPKDGSSLNYSTFFGGNEDDEIISLSVDSTGDVIIGGYTSSYDLPMVSSYNSNKNERTDIFIAKLDLHKTGSASLEFSTYYGGDNRESPRDLFIDSEDNIIICGYTFSRNLDLGAGSYDTEVYEGTPGLGFIFALSSDGANLLFARYHDGAINGVCGEVFGIVALVGDTLSSEFYVKNAFDDEFGGTYGVSDGFLVICDSSLITPLTFVITSNTSTPNDSEPTQLVLLLIVGVSVSGGVLVLWGFNNRKR